MPFVKGQSGNPGGKKKGTKNHLQAAIRAVEKRRKKNLYEHYVERAFESDDVLKDLMKKREPDKKSIEEKVDLEATGRVVFNLNLGGK